MPVNEQITDAVTQSNVKVVAESPAMAMANVYQSAAHSTGILFENAVNTQKSAKHCYASSNDTRYCSDLQPGYCGRCSFNR